ncbi:MAG TPA: hypothetical protein PLX23_02340 [Candidatus Hydrogenedens sp.]|nr:hypothetical protein [Candidatus Hydrogenedens sp.]
MSLPNNNESESQIKKVLKPGVNGLFLLLCLAFIFFAPFVGIYNLINDYQNASPDFGYIPGLWLFMVLESILRAIVILFGIFAGAAILSLWKNAILLTKAYLITFLCTLVLGITLLFSIVKFPPDYYEFVLSKVAYETIASLVYFIVCYLYINFSRRVHITFPESFPETHKKQQK